TAAATAAPAATIQKHSSYAAREGISVPAMTRPASTDAVTAPATLPPAVRTSELIPLAMPLWSIGTCWTASVPSAAYATPNPIPQMELKAIMSYGWEFDRASHT